MRLLPALVLSSAVILHVAAFPTFADETKPPAIREKLDLYGDRLPPGAVLRLGTIRLRHASNVVSVAYSPDGRILATAFVDPEIRLWDVPTGRLIRTLVGSSRNTPRGAAFSPDGHWLAVTCDRGNVQLWGPGSGHLLWEKEAHGDGGQEVIFAPDGRTFATAGGDSTVRLWEAATGAELLVLQITNVPRGIAYSPDGSLLACGEAKQIHLYDVKKGTEAATIDHAHGYEIASLAFAPDGKAIFSAGSNIRIANRRYATLIAELRMWDVAKRTLLRDFFGDRTESSGCVFALSRDGRTLVSEQSNKLIVWDVATGKIKRTIPAYWLPLAVGNKPIDDKYEVHNSGIAISPDGTTMACSAPPLQSAIVWDMATGRQKPAFPDAHSSTSIDALACSADGSRIATGGEDGTVRIWDAQSGKQLQVFVMGNHFPCRIHAIAFAGDGKTMAASGHDRRGGEDVGFVRIWNTKSGLVRREVEAEKNVVKVAFSNDETKLAIETAKYDESGPFRGGTKAAREFWLVVVETRTGVKRQRIKLESPVICLAFSPDGATISAVDGESFSIWKAANGELLQRHEFAAPASQPIDGSQTKNTGRPRIASAVISRDGTRAVVTDVDDVAAIWDLKQEIQIGQIALEKDGILPSSVALSPDNRVIASASRWGDDSQPDNHTIRLWDAGSGRLLKRYQRPLHNPIASMLFTPDGRRLITGMSDGTVLLWDVPSL